MKRDKALFDEIMFPGGKAKTFTMSYDDGTIYDRKLVEIMNRNHIRGTFNLNSGFLGGITTADFCGIVLDTSKIAKEEVCALYNGHEVAGHGLFHGSPREMGSPVVMYEVIADKKNLEDLVKEPVRGYAYPFGAYWKDTKSILRLAGYRYARTVETTHGFELPEDFLEWRGTCHHDDQKLMELLSDFCEGQEFLTRKKLFFLWGHSYEFALKQNWKVIEEALTYVAAFEHDIWFATNIEIYDYVTAFRNLEYSADGNMIYNPSAREIWFRRDTRIYSVSPGSIWRME